MINTNNFVYSWNNLCLFYVAGIVNGIFKKQIIKELALQDKIKFLRYYSAYIWLSDIDGVSTKDEKTL